MPAATAAGMVRAFSHTVEPVGKEAEACTVRPVIPSPMLVWAPPVEASASTANSNRSGGVVRSLMEISASVKEYPLREPDTLRVSDPSPAMLSEATVRSKSAEADKLPAGMVMVKSDTAA